ncbi:MAG: hypothetical protein D6733_05275, partial [Methanobacteriota archaeon]
DGGFAIYREGEPYQDITFLKRPAFFDRETSRGTVMSRLCKMVAPGFPIIYMNRGCMYWGPAQCRFCVVGYIDTEAKKDPVEVAEAVAAGVEEGAIKTHVALTSGALPEDEGLRLLGEAARAIKNQVDIPVSVNAEPPRSMEHIRWLSEADSVYFNVEVYDGRRRREILPGKSEFTIDYYDRVFGECHEYFDENQVASVLLAGLEDDSTYLQGIEHLASLGVVPVPVPFYPTFHSRLEGTDPPSASRMKTLYERSAEIIRGHGLDPFKTRAGFMRGGAIFALKEVMRDV